MLFGGRRSALKRNKRASFFTFKKTRGDRTGRKVTSLPRMESQLRRGPRGKK